MYDMDDTKTTDHYNQAINSLKDFDDEYYGLGPFIYVKGYFALLGYETDDEEILAKDIERVTNGKKLLKILIIVGLLLSSTSCKKIYILLKVYGLKSCGNCRILIDDFKDDENIHLHMIDIDTHILAYKKEIALYDGLSDNQAPVIIQSHLRK